MGRREQAVRAAAAVAILAVLVVLVLRDQGTSPETAGEADADPTVGVVAADPTSSGGTTTDGDPGGSGEPDPATPSDAVPAPPEDLAELVCRQFQQPVRLRVLSFNTHRSTGSINAIAEEVLEIGPDIVLLQEVDRRMVRTGGVDQAGALAEAVGMDGSFSANLVRGSGQYGTLVLSRFDILQQGRVPLVRNPRSEARGLQWATVDVNGQPVRVYNTHLDATRPDVRLQQARQVAGVVAADDLPVVLGGDLNAWPASGAVAAIGRELTDTWTAAGQGRSETSRGGKKIDYLFARGLRPLVSRVAASGASDHHRLWADLRLPPPESCDSLG